jgi:hypothetical protein
LPKNDENDLNLRQIDKTQVKGNKKGAKDVCEKSVKKGAKVQF